MVFTCLLGTILTRANTPDDTVAWAAPTQMATKRVSSVINAQSTPNFLNNTDCSLVTYHVPSSKTMQTGCFTDTAFGLLDSDTNVAIFNETDEGVPLLAYSPNQALIP